MEHTSVETHGLTLKRTLHKSFICHRPPAILTLVHQQTCHLGITDARLSFHLVLTSVSCPQDTVMVNFMYQLDWAVECPDIWSNIILDVFCDGVSWMRLPFKLIDFE